MAATYSLSEKMNQALSHDLKRKMHKFKEGERILVRVPVRTSKLQPRYTGPHTIVKSLGETTYVVNLNGKERSIHIDRLKKFKER